MRILQPAEWSKPRGFRTASRSMAPANGSCWPAETGGDEKGDYAPDMAASGRHGAEAVIKLLGEAGAGPEHIVRLTWNLTSRSEYRAAGAGIGAGPGRRHSQVEFSAIDAALIVGLVDMRRQRSNSKSLPTCPRLDVQGPTRRSRHKGIRAIWHPYVRRRVHRQRISVALDEKSIHLRRFLVTAFAPVP